jgi:hypothetical protein
MNSVSPIAEHERLAIAFERWIGICLRAGETDLAEQCRADAALHARLATKPERKAA